MVIFYYINTISIKAILFQIIYIKVCCLQAVLFKDVRFIEIL